MTEEQAITIPGKAEAPAIFGEKGEVIGLANRLQATARFVKEHNYRPDEILWAANICTVMNLNPWRGEVYFWRDYQGNPVYCEGYKILVRWAQDRCAYDERVEPLPLEEGEKYKFRTFILRHDKREGIAFYKEMGANWREAFETVADWADGVVLEKETVKRNGNPIDPPKGWTWEQKARIRSLKAALRLSHGAPTLQELSAASYQVNGVLTKPEDWEGGEELTGYEASQLAKVKARDRVRSEAWAEMTEEEQQVKFKENVDLMRGPADFEGFGDEPYTEADAARADLAAAQAMDAMNEADAEGNAKPKPAKKPPPSTDERPANQILARIQAEGWNEAATELVAEIGYYTNSDGEPNWRHLCGAAYKMGYPDVTDTNLNDVIEALGMYAEDQQALAAENEAMSQALHEQEQRAEEEGELQKALL
jgi:hypothetical protein